MKIECASFDVVVLGAGLAGLRAAWAALEHDPGLRLVVVSSCPGPGGSSFFNINARLGMQVCGEAGEIEELTGEALALAAPGFADPGLVHILAEESRDRYLDLENLGIEFLRDARGRVKRFPACFSPRSRRAVMLVDPPGTYARFRAKVAALGGEFMSGLLAREILVSNGQAPATARGVLLQSAENPDRLLAIKAKAVVAALGGPAPLFHYNQAGRGVPGYGLGLLARTGANLVNPGYMQFMWAEVDTRKFWPIHRVFTPGMRIIVPGQGPGRLPEELGALAEARAGHCPYGHGLADGALDLCLAGMRGHGGAVVVQDSNGDIRRVAPMAHAGNGGALIDAQGRTTVPDLYACGECAGGMHGANRVGGAMITGTQVFGRRAGKAAALRAAGQSETGGREFRDSAGQAARQAREDMGERSRLLQNLARVLQDTVMREDGMRPASAWVCERGAQARDWMSRLALDSAAALLDRACD